MSRSPAHLRAAAVALRALAAAVCADFDGLAAHSGPATWEGPAASAHRRRADTATEDAHAVAAEVRALADRLDQRAAEVAAAEDAVTRRARERSQATALPDGGRSDG